VNWKEKNVGVMLKRGTSRKRAIVNEDDGTRAGYSVDHWDDSNDAVAQPKTLRLKVKGDDDGA
jgi:hypothetical protein